MSKKLVLGMLVMLVLAALLAACGKSGTSENLDGTEWVLQSLNGLSPLAGTQVTLAFEGGQASGSAGCNSYFGAYRVEGQEGLTFDAIANTEMACLEPAGIMEQETQYLEILRGATSFRISDAELEMTGTGGAVLVYSRAQ